MIFLHLISIFLLINVHYGYEIKDAPVIQTKYGAIKGTADSNAYLYLGIPYAFPPLGNLRWANPVPVTPWTPKVLDATNYKPACPQVHSCSPPSVCPTSFGEDCLYLNVFTPKTNSSTPRAVLFFIHGGNFQYGGSNSPLYNSSMFSSFGDVLIVTINYRLGALGFLVTGLEPDQLQGNFGILDQRVALKWIHENIDAFGGDPKRITIFGQSAGAESVSIHLLSPDMQDYFNSAIIQSSPSSIPFRAFEEMMGLYVFFADILNCTARDIACLRNKSIDDIVAAQMKAETYVTSVKLLEFFEPWLPWLDGKLIKGQLLNIDDWNLPANYTIKPYMMGTLTEECVLYVYGAWGKPFDAQFYMELILGAFKKDGFKVLERYPPDFEVSDQRYLTSLLSTYWVFSCSSRLFLKNTMALSPNNPYYLYVFDFPLDFPGWDGVPYCVNHTCHGGDLPYTYDVPDANFTTNGHLLALSHMNYWSNYAKYGTPNSNETMHFGKQSMKPIKANDYLYWPKYDDKKRNFLRFKSPPNTIESNYLSDECDFLDSIGYYH